MEIDIGGHFFGLIRIETRGSPVQLGEVELTVTPHYFRCRIATGNNKFLEQRRRHTSFEQDFGVLTAFGVEADVVFYQKSSGLMFAFSSRFIGGCVSVWVKGLPGAHKPDDVWLIPSLTACRFHIYFLEQQLGVPIGSIPQLPYLPL